MYDRKSICPSLKRSRPSNSNGRADVCDSDMATENIPRIVPIVGVPWSNSLDLVPLKEPGICLMCPRKRRWDSKYCSDDCGDKMAIEALIKYSNNPLTDDSEDSCDEPSIEIAIGGKDGGSQKYSKKSNSQSICPRVSTRISITASDNAKPVSVVAAKKPRRNASENQTTVLSKKRGRPRKANATQPNSVPNTQPATPLRRPTRSDDFSVVSATQEELTEIPTDAKDDKSPKPPINSTFTQDLAAFCDRSPLSTACQNLLMTQLQNASSYVSYADLNYTPIKKRTQKLFDCHSV